MNLLAFPKWSITIKHTPIQMHVFKVAREGWEGFWDHGWPSTLFALHGWMEMAALRADLDLPPLASSASPMRLFLTAHHSGSSDI